jgi:single-strand DNA-binding protein
MPNFNHITIVGHITRDPQLSYLPSQTAVCDCGIAETRKFKKQDGNTGEQTCFVDLKIFGKQAENFNKYVQKGKAMLISGRLCYDSWTAQDGSKRSKHYIGVDTYQFLGGSPTGGAGTQRNGPSEPEPENDSIPF